MTSLSCPYCAGADFADIAERRPGQFVQQCGTCQQFSVQVRPSGRRYAMSNPQNQNSEPQTRP